MAFHLLQYQTPAPEWDILNQNTFDEYDWFLYIFCICCAGCGCFWIGWFWHRCHIKNYIVKDKDVVTYSTPITNSMSLRAKRCPPELLASAWEEQKAQKTQTTLATQHSAVSVDKVLTCKTSNATILMMPMGKEHKEECSDFAMTNAKQEEDLKEESESMMRIFPNGQSQSVQARRCMEVTNAEILLMQRKHPLLT